MDCLQACEILSAAHDGDPVDAALLAEAKRHAESCAECRAFAGVLDRIAATPAPRAPERLVTRLEELAAIAATGIREAPAPSPDPAPGPELADLHEHPEPARWLPRFTAFASAAAVMLVVLMVGSIALLGGRGQQATESADRTFDETQLTAPTAEDATANAVGSAAPVIVQPSPPCVSLDSAVWLLTGPATPDPSTLATAGVVASALDGQSQADHPAYFAGTDRTTLYVKTSDARFLAFTRVVRTLGRAPYGLVTGTPLPAFGAWPTLPERFGQPQAADGSPAFRLAGFDDANLDVFVPSGGNLTDGFAVAPGTPADDPAAGNPNWTWWERLE